MTRRLIPFIFLPLCLAPCFAAQDTRAVIELVLPAVCTNMRGIALHDVRVSGGGKINFNAYAKHCRDGVILDGVQLIDAAA